MGWSSAMSILIMRLLLFFVVEGHDYLDDGPPARKPAEFHPSFQAAGTFPHADQPERLRVEDLLFGDTLAIVRHGCHKFITPFRQGNLYPRCFRMPDDVCQRFLNDAEERSGTTQVQCAAIETVVKFTDDTRSFLKFLRVPFDRRCETEVVQDGRTQFRGNSPHYPDRLIEMRFHFERLFEEFTMLPGQFTP